MDVVLSAPRGSDAREFIDAVQASRSLHHPWIDPPDSATRFAHYIERAGLDDHAAYLVRHGTCGELVGFVNVNSIVRGAFQSGYLGYAAFASHAGCRLMTQGLGAVLDVVFGQLQLHRVEANIQPTNERSINLVRRLGFSKEGFSPGYLKVDEQWRDHERWALRMESWTSGGTVEHRRAG